MTIFFFTIRVSIVSEKNCKKTSIFSTLALLATASTAFFRIKHHQNGKTSYYHPMLGAVLLHPNCREVIPLALNQLLDQMATLSMIVNVMQPNAYSTIFAENILILKSLSEDSLSSNGPHIQLLKDLDMRFILGAKPADHTFLFDWINHSNPEIFKKIE